MDDNFLEEVGSTYATIRIPLNHLAVMVTAVHSLAAASVGHFRPSPPT